MRSLFAVMLAGLGFMVMAAPLAAQSAGRIGFVDSRRIMAEAPGAQDVRRSIEQEMERFQSELRVMQDSLQQLYTAYQQQAATMSPERRRQREEEIVAKQRSFEERAEQLEEAAARRQNELMEPVMSRVNDAIARLREEGGFAIIFDAATAGMVAADPALDLTTQVLERLRQAGPAAVGPRNP